MTNKKYDWIVVGGGIGGIALAEILSREGLSVLVLEKNATLASETSKDFHEWLHTGSLYALTPDKLLTTRYLLGAIDDLLEFYSSFPRQNVEGTASGLRINGPGWFNENKILFKYRNRRFNLIWSALVSRSLSIVKKIKSHDWLRRRAGALYGDSRLSRRNWFDSYMEIFRSRSEFFEIESPDITMNSRVLIDDLISNAMKNGAEVLTNQNITDVQELEEVVKVFTHDREFISDKVVICAPELIASLFDKKIAHTFAPIAVVKGLPENAKSFVELDYYTKTCINLLTKGDGIGQAGGISLSNESQVAPYLDYVISQHKKRYPSMEVVGSYVGLKREVVQSGHDRGYLYHIDKQSDRVWSMILGKFTLAFSAAPEFYRQVYDKNPSKDFNAESLEKDASLVSNTAWNEIITENKA